MLIANPLYDVVFKYLLDDNKVAKLFIGAILDVEVTELEFKPQEIPMLFSKIEENEETRPEFKVLRIDFKAQITYPDGTSMLVLIELQKAKRDADLMRFRKYLGAQYIDPNNSITVEGVKKPLPIITIYFLGYNLRNFEQIPIIRVKRQYIDNHNQEVLQQREPFVEVLTHDSIVIQLPQIKQKRRNELEEILSIFELQNVQKFDMKFTLPEKYEEITKRLNLALTDEQIRNGMLAQEEMIHELESNAQAIATERKIKITAIQNLKKKGMSIVEIATIFDLSEEEINKLLL
jgi:hypothetical protein